MKPMTDFKLFAQGIEAVVEESKIEVIEIETPPAVEELSENPPSEGGEPVPEPAPVEGEPKPEGEGEPAAEPVEGAESAPAEPGAEEPAVEEPQPEKPAEAEEPGPYHEPEDTPALIEDMQHCLSMLRQSSKDIPLGEEDKELNPGGVEIDSAPNPAEGEVSAPITAEGEVAAPIETSTGVVEAPVEQKLTLVEGDLTAVVEGEVSPGIVEVQPEMSGDAQETVEEKPSDQSN
ncbi:skin secretory protein xP2-like [Homalodisca vitripennis]|uniref:skin secretory protein xP2-like n=1 Tax=Homalodisca vitripennis TaxID=197043 RepID=UPI001EEAB659|nr:skin secretory protein xP2-like [Homalodisca vitripennis]